ncbi:DNA starvation/stationary phase protection protein [Paenibacillus hemerocallicola]|uniref:DNA starvation/stationary phase protection protein n=1 Tax=Paenibacillus hemerocallicola TaxID=1172614 RepID=A0A5C4TC89_9BACL|nr:Dps family protein [Paenibacillus hemerocallicola]TNJ66693.1 DNA starvation/stationary phase protection protein [Paenibacillus hemerocallicola]
MATATETKSVVETINKQIANWGVLYVKIHNFHWFVKGKQFFTLHEKFEELYKEADLRIDELAERVLSIKGRPIATMKEMLAESSIKEANGDESADQMVKTIVKDFQTMIGEMRKAIDLAEEAGDHTSADMMTSVQTSLEKHVWMLEAALG